MEFVIINGTVISKKEAQRGSFLSDDVFVISHKIWYGFGGVPLLNENLEILHRQTNGLGARLPDIFHKPRELFRRCKRMLNKNKFYRTGHLIFTLFISGAHVDYTITAQNREIFEFPIADKGLLVNIAKHNLLSSSALSSLPVHHQLLWKNCEAELKNSIYSSSLLLNEKGFVSEAIRSNLFVLKNKVLFTPSLSTGCYQDVLRTTVLRLAGQMKVKSIETDELTVEMLPSASEMFLVSEAGGIEWILGLENKRFVREFSLDLHEEINSYLKQKVS